MSLELSNFETATYTVVTTYEDGCRSYSVVMLDKTIADDFKNQMKRGLFGARTEARTKVKSIVVIEKTITVKERIVD